MTQKTISLFLEQYEEQQTLASISLDSYLAGDRSDVHSQQFGEAYEDFFATRKAENPDQIRREAFADKYNVEDPNEIYGSAFDGEDMANAERDFIEAKFAELDKKADRWADELSWYQDEHPQLEDRVRELEDRQAQSTDEISDLQSKLESERTNNRSAFDKLSEKYEQLKKAITGPLPNLIGLRRDSVPGAKEADKAWLADVVKATRQPQNQHERDGQEPPQPRM